MRQIRQRSATAERKLTTASDLELLKRSFPRYPTYSGIVDPEFDDEPGDVRTWVRFTDNDTFADDWDLIKW